MELAKLTEAMRNAGIVGAGGAGFPSYAKLNNTADTIILNCAECEPLLKLHRQVMRDYANEIMVALEEVADALDVQKVIIAIKGSYKEAIEAIKSQISSFKKIEIGILPETYPAGDEVITIYETTGRVVPPGSIPIAVGCIVYNVETMLNVYNAIKADKPVTKKFVTIAGEVKNPVTVEVPLGITVKELIDLAGGLTREDVALVGGGPMTGMLTSFSDVVTKTTNAILVLPENNFVIEKRKANKKVNFNRARAACCDCRYCTDLCPRNHLGHPISPADFMTAAVSNTTENVKPFLDTLYCSACGVCEMFACTQGLSPRTLIAEYKSGLRKNGVLRGEVVEPKPVLKDRSYRAISKHRLTTRLGLASYDVAAPIVPVDAKFGKVKIKLSQHIGAPCEATVKAGDAVKAGDVIAKTPDGKLGVWLHASIDGVVSDVSDGYITITDK